VLTWVFVYPTLLLVNMALNVIAPHMAKPLSLGVSSIVLTSLGRVFLGLGTGERLNEQAATGQFGPYTERHDRLIEAIGLIRSAMEQSANLVPRTVLSNQSAQAV
jgi:hypothetical protein